jgi:hypothetical protein
LACLYVYAFICIYLIVSYLTLPLLTDHRHDDHEFDEYVDPGGTVLKLGKLTKSVFIPGAKRDRGYGSSDDEARYVSKRRREKRTVIIKRNLRLPQVLFAASIEAQLMLLWNKKSNHAFRFPVDATLYPNYYTTVTTPICLMEIRDNLGKKRLYDFVPIYVMFV